MAANEEQDPDFSTYCIFLFICEHDITFIILQVSTFINVFISSMLSFYQYKIINQSIFFAIDL